MPHWGTSSGYFPPISVYRPPIRATLFGKHGDFEFQAAPNASFVFETTLRCNFGIQLWQTWWLWISSSSNCPQCFCRLVRLQQIALVKDLSQELTNSGDGSWMLRSEGNSTRSSFWMNIDTSFVVNSCKRVSSVYSFDVTGMFFFTSWQLPTFQILTNPAPEAIKHQL